MLRIAQQPTATPPFATHLALHHSHCRSVQCCGLWHTWLRMGCQLRLSGFTSAAFDSPRSPQVSQTLGSAPPPGYTTSFGASIGPRARGLPIADSPLPRKYCRRFTPTGPTRALWPITTAPCFGRPAALGFSGS